MKKIINILGFSAIFVSITNSCSAALISNTTAIKANADKINTAAGLGAATIGDIIAAIIQAGLGLLAAIFVVLMIMAGFQWMTAGGNEQQTKKAQDTIKTAVIGLVIVLAAYAITYFVFKYIPFNGAGPQGVGSGVN